MPSFASRNRFRFKPSTPWGFRECSDQPLGDAIRTLAQPSFLLPSRFHHQRYSFAASLPEVIPSALCTSQVSSVAAAPPKIPTSSANEPPAEPAQAPRPPLLAHPLHCLRLPQLGAVAIRSPGTLIKFMQGGGGQSATRTERAAIVRILDLQIGDWLSVHASLARLIPRLAGLRALVVVEDGLDSFPWSRWTQGDAPIRVTTTVIGAILALCPKLVVLETTTLVKPPATSETEAVGVGDEDWFDHEAVARGVIKCLRLCDDRTYHEGPIDDRGLGVSEMLAQAHGTWDERVHPLSSSKVAE
ncbi:hypothetical protein BDK51DRAFT_41674 [Blyttiomyces helicus]|uniref:Uncharacterized protein n=1 Tax=Blyttiomyces helicus TaxID=388810 RepID=A0A4P9WP37_9FUNG|nr:hypothetical protein BDK51DRAFT_41674 [Blyttiomyces helicus]|eukprot:RKO94065.1 hypothetical protein BDK51DRAFT_41674 [Blyttiomyces helicus]